MNNPVFMNISEAARRSGLSAKLIRHYEDIGLIRAPARSDSGYRLYNSRNVEQLSFVHHARELGFTTAQISDLVRLRDNPARASREVKAVAEQQLHMLEQRMAQLQAMKQLLTDMIHQCAGNDDPHCVILDTLASDEAQVSRHE